MKPKRNPEEFVEVIARFAAGVREAFNDPIWDAHEEQLKNPVGDLLSEVGELFGWEVASQAHARAPGVRGTPDIGVATGGLPTGWVELKRPDKSIDPRGFTQNNKKQWERFRAIPNLVYTNGSEWRWYSEGKPKGQVLISGDITTGTVDSAGVDSLCGLLSGFLGWQPVVPKTPRGLAEKLAPLTRYLKNETARELSAGNETLQQLANEWRKLLFPGGDETRIADAYAQTVTFSLLLARLEGAGDLSGHGAIDALKRGHPLLSASLEVLKDEGMKEVPVPMSLLERFIGAVDLGSIGTRDETWLYFYEYFLQAYNPAVRKTRGVYFTPMEVVRCQVRLADHLLRTRLGKPKGLAHDEVVVLDPAVGTGAYPLAALDHVERAHRKRVGETKEVIASFAGRLYAFEVLVGPYAIARMRLARHFREAGIEKEGPLKDGPLVYLTDTLADDTPANDHPMLWVARKLLAEEGRAAQKVKDNTNVMVCMGNPPWYRETTEPDTADSDSSRDGGWVRHRKNENGVAILDDFVDKSASEHVKNLYNDYVYFWRWALWKVFETRTEGGLVTFVTPNSYLRGPGFGGMRKKMRETFDHLWIIDLEGDKRRRKENLQCFRPQDTFSNRHRHPGGACEPRPTRPSTRNPAGWHKKRETGIVGQNRRLGPGLAGLETVLRRMDRSLRTSRNGHLFHMAPNHGPVPLSTLGSPVQKNLAHRRNQRVAAEKMVPSSPALRRRTKGSVPGSD